MKMKRLALVSALFVGFLMTGCASTNLTAEVSPHADLSALKSFYVVKFPSDGRGLQELIANELRSRGFEATSGVAEEKPTNVDALVTYQDHWMWDITMYMIEINIQFRDPENDVILASGNSSRTSLARKDPEFMINEVFTEMYGE